MFEIGFLITCYFIIGVLISSLIVKHAQKPTRDGEALVICILWPLPVAIILLVLPFAILIRLIRFFSK